MIKNRIESFIRPGGRTLLGVGPMSLNCTNAAVEIADEHNVPLLLIASRRQIDSSEFGGGYVNGWTTEEFCKYVASKRKTENAILARDHGGPWQSDKEKLSKLNLSDAMKSAKLSFQRDIEAGMQVIHVDPSIDIHGHLTIEETLNRAFELYEHCWSVASKLNREILFEVGTEEQSGQEDNEAVLDHVLSSIKKFCDSIKAPMTSFVVVQCGTRVMETKNVGSLGGQDTDPSGMLRLRRMIDICNEHGVFLKEHNTDYLSDEVLRMHPVAGIHSANVAPEFGVLETRSLIKFLNDRGLKTELERFLEISYASKKWEKWMLPGTDATDFDRSVIAGHYVFSDPRVIDLKASVDRQTNSAGASLDEHLKQDVKIGICRYLKNFRCIIP